jgi:hypothetical protein
LLFFFSGNGSVWHGDADILVKRSVIKISCDDDLDDGSGEPEKKRIKIGSVRDDDNSTSDESFDSTVEVKRDVISTRAMAQGLAQTIVNAFCEVKKKPSLSNTFIPSFISNEKIIKMTLYNCEIDRLIMTKDLKLFTYDNESKPILNFSTILSIWYALNFEIFIENPESEKYLELKESKIKEHARHKLSVYKDSCTKPFTPNEVEKDVDFEIGFGGFCAPVSTCITNMVLSNRKVKSVLSDQT